VVIDSPMIRVTPGIDIGGHPAVTTGVDDQKFGFALTAGLAVAAAQRVLHQPALQLVGLHCHIGSQVTDATLYGEVIRRLIATMADIRRSNDVVLHELNIGGGHGVPYRTGDPELQVAELADIIEDALD
jgi:diaminopimelate decarboxylase